MNYYEHHLGDYDGATAHLTWLEDCAYRRMLCLYYRTESPLPADPKQVCRLVRATSKFERDAVQQVLGEFFVLADDGWRNTRCDEDIAAYHELEPEREAKRENAKERQRRARQRRAELFEALRGHNIVPPYDTTTKALEALLSRVTDAQPVTPAVTPVTSDNTATHTHLPPPTSQIEEKTSSSSSAEPTGKPTIPCPYRDIVAAYHEALPTLPKVRVFDGKLWDGRCKAMRELWGWVLSSRRADETRRATNADEAMGWIRDYFARAAMNDFVMGRTPRSAQHANWRCDLDFLLTDRGMKHVIEKTQLKAVA